MKRECLFHSRHTLTNISRFSKFIHKELLKSIINLLVMHNNTKTQLIYIFFIVTGGSSGTTVYSIYDLF